MLPTLFKTLNVFFVIVVEAVVVCDKESSSIVFEKKIILTMINNHKSIKLNKLYVPNTNNNKKVSRQRDIEIKR